VDTRDERIASIDDVMHDIFGRLLRPPTPPTGEMNITMGQLHCLRSIGHLKNPTMSQVADELRLHPSTVTVLVDGLVAHGLVERTADPTDRRVVRVNETAEGRKNREQHMAQMRGRIRDMLAELSDTDLGKVHDSLEILRGAARRYVAGRTGAER
jgi:DNA-binding MarR family transcriptional regulator